MGSDWPKLPLSDIAEVFTGYPFKGDKYLPPAQGVRVVRGDNVTERFVRWGEKEKCWSNITEDLKPYVLRAGDVVVGMDGSKVGKNFAAISNYDDGALLAQRVARIRAKEGVSQDFLRYLICNQNFTEYVQSVHTGTSIPHISKGQIERFEVIVPPLHSQKAIASILAAIDDRITLLRETNSTLEAIAQALFKSWFVDFDPVRAKSEGNLPEGIDEAIAAPFPDAFEETELGMVPKGWRVSALSEIANLNAQSWSVRNAPCEVTYVDLAGVKSNIFDALQSYPFADAPSRARRILQKNDCIVGTVRPGNRSFGFIAQADNNLTGSTGFAVLSPKQKDFAAFVYLCATQEANIDRLAALADGGSYPAVKPELVADTPCVLPTDEVMKAFDEIAKPLLYSVGANSLLIQILSALRDTLLPRLISGQLRIADVEAELEKVTA